MNNTKSISVSVFLLACSNVTLAQTKKPSSAILVAETPIPAAQEHADERTAALEAQREKRALQAFLNFGQTIIVSAADAMPADQYGFAPTDGEFKGVRTFGQQVKHLAAANHILAAAALSEEPQAGAGDEMGPETVRAEAESID
jgi:hypothetical protein